VKLAMKESILIFIILIYFTSVAFAQTGETVQGDMNSTENMTSNSHIGENNSISGYNPRNHSHNIHVILDHIFIQKENDSLEISENVVFRNEGSEIHYSKNNHMYFAISTPQEAENLKTPTMECCLVQEDGMVYMDPMKPVKHGDNFEMQVSYKLLPKGSDYVFNKSAVYNTTSLLMFVDKGSGVSFEGLYETLKLNGNEYNVIAFNDIKAGEIVTVPIKMTQKQSYLVAGIVLFSLFSVGLVYHFWGKIFRKRGKGYTLEELELEKRKIFQAIHSFEKHAGQEKSEEYRKLMDEYREKAIRIFIEIDKLKIKVNLNH
jgi:hypothetical protein